jgi:predicted nucleotidyltransferase
MAVLSDPLIEMVRVGLVSWAERNGAVREMWVFGSRVRGTAAEDSDMDIGLALMPPDDSGTNWALGAFFALHPQWRLQLETIVGRHVSLEPMVPNTKGDVVIRETGIMLRARP